jgi:hypothetical protein
MPLFCLSTHVSKHLLWLVLPTIVVSASSVTLAFDKPPAMPPVTEPASAPTETPPPTIELPPLSEDAKRILDRLLKQYENLPGLSVIARHRIQAPDRVLHESTRTLAFAQPNRFRVNENGTLLATSDGAQCWIFDRQKGGYNEMEPPASMTRAIADIRVLGGGDVAGSGGLVAALLSTNQRLNLLGNVSQVDVMPAGDDDLLILHVRKNRGTVRSGTRIGLFIPKAGPAWLAQADIIPKDVTVHTRVVFEKWAPSAEPADAFALNANALKLKVLDQPKAN